MKMMISPTDGRGSITRITKMSRRGRVLGQYGYYVMPISAKPAPGKFADNGISEILALDNSPHAGAGAFSRRGRDRLEVITSVSSRATALPQPISRACGIWPKATYTLKEKRLVLDLSKDEAIGHTDNIEGMAFGPRLANGHRTLVACVR